MYFMKCAICRVIPHVWNLQYLMEKTMLWCHVLLWIVTPCGCYNSQKQQHIESQHCFLHHTCGSMQKYSKLQHHGAAICCTSACCHMCDAKNNVVIQCVVVFVNCNTHRVLQFTTTHGITTLFFPSNTANFKHVV